MFAINRQIAIHRAAKKGPAINFSNEDPALAVPVNNKARKIGLMLLSETAISGNKFQPKLRRIGDRRLWRKRLRRRVRTGKIDRLVKPLAC